MVEQRISRYESNEYNRISAGFSFSIRGRRGMEARESVEANDKTTRDDDVRPRDFSNEVASRGRGEREREDIAVSDRGGYINALTKTLATIFFPPSRSPRPLAPWFRLLAWRDLSLSEARVSRGVGSISTRRYHIDNTEIHTLFNRLPRILVGIEMRG